MIEYVWFDLIRQIFQKNEKCQYAQKIKESSQSSSNKEEGYPSFSAKKLKAQNKDVNNTKNTKMDANFVLLIN